MSPVKEPVLPASVEYIIKKLSDSGYRGDIVGGCVRDFLLERELSDYDITTNATPCEVKRVFEGEKIIDTGIKHGTVTLVIDKVPYEITTWRIDGEYLDARHPSGIEFARELRLDLERRDFTMNAICYNPTHKFTDCFGGIEDIKNGIIRTVGDAEKRFSEDALRILRALRFSSTLGFKIEEKTRAAIFKMSHLLKNLSRERVFSEWQRMLAGMHFHKIILEYAPVISVAIPGIDVSLIKDEEAFSESPALARGISLFADANGYGDAMRSLHSDNKSLKIGTTVLENINGAAKTDIDLLRLLSKTDRESAELLLRVRSIRKASGKEDIERLFRLLSKNPAYKISHLKISGDDLLKMGFSGARVGEALSFLLSSVICGKCENTYDALVSEVSNYKQLS